MVGSDAGENKAPKGRGLNAKDGRVFSFNEGLGYNSSNLGGSGLP